MKNFLLYAFSLFCFNSIIAAQAYVGSIKYDKKKQKAVMIEYAYSPEAVQNAFIQKMEQMGYKPKEEKGIFNSDKGFLIFSDAFITDINNDKMDFIVKVERKSRKEKEEAVFYMIMNSSDKNMLDVMNAEELSNAKMFLNNMVPDIEVADLEIQIKVQEETVVTAEKKMRDLKDEQANLEKKLQENKTDQADTQKDIENQKQVLGELIGKRRGNRM